MNVETLVDDYIEAWNRHDLTKVLDFLDNRAAFYDAYWMEYCTGRELSRYLQDSFEEEPFWYERVSDLIAVDNSVVYRYIAHERTDSNIGPAIFNGAEVITFRDNKIISSSDYYCNPDQTALEEVTRLAGRHHAEMRHVKFGLGALKEMRFRRLLSDILDQEKVYLDANLTQVQLAYRIGCSVDHLSQIIGKEFGTSFQTSLDQYRVRHARELLLKESEDPNYVSRVAFQSGFRSLETFNISFRRLLGETPEEFRNQNSKEIKSANKPISH